MTSWPFYGKLRVASRFATRPKSSQRSTFLPLFSRNKQQEKKSQSTALLHWFNYSPLVLAITAGGFTSGLRQRERLISWTRGVVTENRLDTVNIDSVKLFSLEYIGQNLESALPVFEPHFCFYFLNKCMCNIKILRYRRKVRERKMFMLVQ